MPNKCPPLWRSLGFSHPRWYFLQILRISNRQIPSFLIVKSFYLDCSRYICTCCFSFCTPYKYMGRYAPKERKNRGKVTKILWDDTIVSILVCKMGELWECLLRRGGAQEASFSHARVTRAHSLQTCTFCFHNLHSRRHYSSLSFLTPRYFSVFSARLPWSIFRAVFPILGRKIV